MSKIYKELGIEIDTDCRECKYSYTDYSWFCGLFGHTCLAGPGLTSEIIPRCEKCIKVFGNA